MRIPWCDCKVAYSVNNTERLWRAYDAGKMILPEGWEMNGTDCSGARCVVLFRVNTLPTIEDGRVVAALVRRFGR